jgi:hypothetical protein
MKASLTVSHNFITLQENLKTKGLVFCSMCDEMHENNTFCQAPDDYFDRQGGL